MKNLYQYMNSNHYIQYSQLQLLDVSTLTILGKVPHYENFLKYLLVL